MGQSETTRPQILVHVSIDRGNPFATHFGFTRCLTHTQHIRKRETRGQGFYSLIVMRTVVGVGVAGGFFWAREGPTAFHRARNAGALGSSSYLPMAFGLSAVCGTTKEAHSFQGRLFISVEQANSACRKRASHQTPANPRPEHISANSRSICAGFRSRAFLFMGGLRSLTLQVGNQRTALCHALGSDIQGNNLDPPSMFLTSHTEQETHWLSEIQ